MALGGLGLLRQPAMLGRCPTRQLRLAVCAKSTGGTKERGTKTSSEKRERERQEKRQQLAEKKRVRKILEKTPIISRLLDGALMMGDAVMISATELSSTRIHWDQDLKYLLGVMVITWFVAAFSLGDYRGVTPSSENFYVQAILGPTFISFLDATVTWAVAAVLSLLSYSFLVNQCIIDPASLMDGLGTDDLSPQLEVAVASLITMPCWRGIAAKIRS